MRLQRFSGAMLLMLGLLSGCHRPYQFAGQQYQRVTVDATTARPDSVLSGWLQPYRQKLDQSMNEVLTRTTEPMDKKKPESAFNNLLCDALLQQAQVKYGKPVDMSHLNFGGIRAGFPKGHITVGNVFEVMPFDNQLVLVTVDGKMLMQFLNHFLTHDESALVVGGIRVRIHDNAIQSVTFTNGRTLQPDQTYTIALSDYVANGGGGANFLKNALKREDLAYLIRDAFLEYFRQQGKSGQPLTNQTDGRIIIE